VGRRIVPVTSQTLGDLPQPCRDCAFWEAGPWPRGGLGSALARATLKADWVESTGSAWGPCGLIAYVDDVPAGYVMYAPPAFVPRAAAFATSPVGADAVLLTAARVVAERRGEGLGRVLVQAAAKDLSRRGVRAIEAYGAAPGVALGSSENGSSPCRSVDEDCVLPVDYLEAVGFVRVREHARNPRLRLDLRTALTWRDPVGGALEKIRGAVRPFPAGANRT
jgi:GNAT superfamily N-acetyltransferase